MKTFEISTSAKEYKLNIPTSFDEITPDYLDKVTRHINVAPYYSLVAIIYRDKLPTIFNSFKGGKSMNAAVVVRFIKTSNNNNSDNNFILDECCTGDTVAIAASDISMGLHAYAPNNKISISSVCSICADNDKLYKDSLTDTNWYYFVEFKIVPNSAIKAVIKEDDMENGNEFFEVSKK